MDVEIVVHGDPAGDEVRNLRGWLLDEPDLHGRVSLREPPAEPGTLSGGIPEALVVAAVGGGTALALVRTLGNVLITWLKTRRGQVDITVVGADGAKVVLATKDVRGLSADGVREVLDELTRTLTGSPGQDGPAAAGRPNSASADAADSAGAAGASGADRSAGTAGGGRGRTRRRADPAS